MKTFEKICAVLSLIALLTSFALGHMRSQDALGEQFKSFVPNMISFTEIAQDIYVVQTPDSPDAPDSSDASNTQGTPDTPVKQDLLVALAEYPGYAGTMLTAVVVNAKGTLLSVAIVESPDTPPYIKQVLDARIPDAYLGANIQKIPNPASVSGATLSSVALKKGIAGALAKIMSSEKALEAFPQMHVSQENIAQAKVYFAENMGVSLSFTEIVKIALVFIFFACALFISSKRFPQNKILGNKKIARYALLVSSILFLGFLYGTQFSLSTLLLLFSGAWMVGLASYAPLICLILALAIFIMSKKNIYCMFICPFGAVQEGVSLIINCKSPHKSIITTWTSRFFALFLLCFALFFSQGSAISYEPFGKMFNFVGSLTLFILTCCIMIASLFVKKPWCALLCPMTPIFDYIAFWRRWLFSSKNSAQTSTLTQEMEI